MDGTCEWIGVEAWRSFQIFVEVRGGRRAAPATSVSRYSSEASVLSLVSLGGKGGKGS